VATEPAQNRPGQALAAAKSSLGAALRRRDLPRALVEVVAVAAVIALCGFIGAHKGWSGVPRTATATALWPFYLDTWVRQTVWSGRLLLPFFAFLCARPLWRRFCAPANIGDASNGNIDGQPARGEVDLLIALVGLAYLFHLGCGAVRFGIGDGLTHTMTRWQEYFRDVPCVARGFLAHFPEGCALSMHAAAHPPGILLLLAGVQLLGFVKADDATLVCATLAALAALPIYGAARRFADASTARLAAALYLYASSIACFAVLSMDMAILLFGAVALYGLSRALHDEEHAWRGGILWGLGLFVASMCSFLVGTLLLSYAALILPRLRRLSRKRWLALLLGPATFFAAYALLILWTGYRPIHVLRQNLLSLSLSFDAERSTELSYLGNPIAFLGSLGLPLCGLYVHAWGTAIVRIIKRRADRDTVVLLVAAALPIALSIALGKPRAEVERVYLPFVPLLVIAAASAARRFYDRGPDWLLDVALPLSVLQTLLTEVYFDTYW
jgi:hypothetical protein